MNRIYVGGGTVFSEGDYSGALYRCDVTVSGASVSMVSSYIGGSVHADIHALVFAPGDPNQLWVGCDGGVFFSPEPSGEAVDQSVVARGAELAQRLHCASCHKADYEGQEQMPRLAPQRIDYLIKSLTEYREGKRYGIDTSMNGVMYRVPDRDIRALAHYLGSLR